VVQDDPETTDVVEGAWFRELGGIGSGLYFWVAGPGSNVKVSVQIGSRAGFAGPEDGTHTLGTISPSSIVISPIGVTPPTTLAISWLEGAWEYVDEALLVDSDPVTFDGFLPADRTTARVNFEGLTSNTSIEPAASGIVGRFENMDTLVLIVADNNDERNIDQDQVKIVDTVVKFTVQPTKVQYGCGAGCQNIVITVEDPDENLNCNEIEYVPVFVIINPGAGTPHKRLRSRTSASS
jgi:hypothetical protein